MMSPLPTISQAFSLIKMDEKQKQDNHLAMPFLGSISDVQTKHVAVTGKKSSIGAQGVKSTLKCTYYNKEGHIGDFCFKLVGYPDKKKGKGKQKSNVGFKTIFQQC